MVRLYDARMPDPSIPTTEYAKRRAKVRTALRGAVGVLFAGDHDAHLPSPYRPNPHFEYLTGVVDEPGAVLVLDSKGPVESRRDMLFLKPLNPELEKWDGYRLEIASALRERVGVSAVYRTLALPRFLSDAAARAGKVACLHPFAWYDQPVSPDLAIFRKLQERIPGLEITDATNVIAKLRGAKSAAEVKMIQRAIDITAIGFDAVLKSVAPGQTEFDVQESLEHGFRSNGSRGPAYGSIVGAGINSTVLHYHANDAPIEDGDLICIDAGASFGGYGADITRTIPANGKFTKRQREIYDIVLTALLAATKAVKPGTTMAQVDRIARAVITKAGYGDAFIHGTGHPLGLETHDVDYGGPLQIGQVVTVEPGIYLPDEKIGIRLEDDVLVTKSGHRVLSSKIPRNSRDIEKAMA